MRGEKSKREVPKVGKEEEVFDALKWLAANKFMRLIPCPVPSAVVRCESSLSWNVRKWSRSDQKDSQASWTLVKARPPPKGNTPSQSISIDDSDFQVPSSAPSFCSDPDYPMDYNRFSNPRWVTPMVTVAAINPLFSDHPKCLDLIFIYLSGLTISIGSLRLLKHASVEGWCNHLCSDVNRRG